MNANVPPKDDSDIGIRLKSVAYDPTIETHPYLPNQIINKQSI